MMHQCTRRSILTEPEARFVSYVSITLHFEARRVARRNRGRLQRQVPLPEEYDRPKCPALPDTDEIHHLVENHLEDILSDSRLHRAVTELTEVQRMILYRVIVIGNTERELAAELGVSQQAVSKSKQSALSKLRTASVKAS